MDILEHWEAVAATIAVLAALFGFFARNWFGNVNRGIRDNTTDIASLKGQVAEMIHDHDDIKKDIRGHVEREETLLWPKVDGMILQITNVQTEMASLKANMPNGELKTLLRRFAVMEEMFKSTVKHLERTIDEVDREQREHNVEAEGWKRRIVILEGKVGEK